MPTSPTLLMPSTMTTTTSSGPLALPYPETDICGTRVPIPAVGIGLSSPGSGVLALLIMRNGVRSSRLIELMPLSGTGSGGLPSSLATRRLMVGFTGPGRSTGSVERTIGGGDISRVLMLVLSLKILLMHIVGMLVLGLLRFIYDGRKTID